MLSPVFGFLPNACLPLLLHQLADAGEGKTPHPSSFPSKRFSDHGEEECGCFPVGLLTDLEHQGGLG